MLEKPLSYMLHILHFRYPIEADVKEIGESAHPVRKASVSLKYVLGMVDQFKNPMPGASMFFEAENCIREVIGVEVKLSTPEPKTLKTVYTTKSSHSRFLDSFGKFPYAGDPTHSELFSSPFIDMWLIFGRRFIGTVSHPLRFLSTPVLNIVLLQALTLFSHIILLVFKDHAFGSLDTSTQARLRANWPFKLTAPLSFEDTAADPFLSDPAYSSSNREVLFSHPIIADFLKLDPSGGKAKFHLIYNYVKRTLLTKFFDEYALADIVRMILSSNVLSTQKYPADATWEKDLVERLRRSYEFLVYKGIESAKSEVVSASVYNVDILNFDRITLARNTSPATLVIVNSPFAPLYPYKPAMFPPPAQWKLKSFGEILNHLINIKTVSARATVVLVLEPNLSNVKLLALLKEFKELGLDKLITVKYRTDALVESISTVDAVTLAVFAPKDSLRISHLASSFYVNDVLRHATHPCPDFEKLIVHEGRLGLFWTVFILPVFSRAGHMCFMLCGSVCIIHFFRVYHLASIMPDNFSLICTHLCIVSNMTVFVSFRQGC